MSSPTTRATPVAPYRSTQEPGLRPIGLTASLAYFGLPAAFTFLSYHVFRPWLERAGYDALTSYLAALCVAVALLFAAALIFYRKVEGRPLTWTAFSARMRLPRLRWRDLGWALGIFIGGMAGMGLLSMVSQALIQAGWMPLPAHMSMMDDPRVPMSVERLAAAAGGVLKGRWDIAALYLVTFFFNIVGEELWWRGIILPRQELAFGRQTWLVHGLMWASFHVFKWWDILSLVPVCLLLSYCAQRTRSTWGGMIGHALANGLEMLGILFLIFS